MPYSFLQQHVNSAYGLADARDDIKQEINNDTVGINDTVKNLYGVGTSQKSNDYQSILSRINPFLKSDGSLRNPDINYQKVLDDGNIGNQAKTFIENATGLKRAASNNTATITNSNTALMSVNPGDLMKLDVTQMPKLSTDQISTIISKYFSKSTVISPSDAQGIFDAQTKSGMSALAILGIGALESGYGTSSIAKAKNNLWGWGATNSNPSGNAKGFSQMSQGAYEFASKYMSTYYNKYGAKSIYDAGTGNNPAGKGYAYYDNGGINANWATQVSSIMQKFYNSIGGGGTPSGNTTSSNSASGGTTNTISPTGNALVDGVSKYLGTPYVSGGTSPKGFDCSGLIYYVAGQNGINLHRVSKDQYAYDGTKVNSKSDLQPGDLLFFDTHGSNDGNVSHVGIYAGNGKMIHSPHTGDVVKQVDFSNSRYYQNAFVGAKRI